MQRSWWRGNKTVNIYSFSLASWLAVVEQLNLYVARGNTNCYYETVFAEMVANKSLSFESVSFDHQPWYEVDNIHDLAEAEKLFPVALSTQDNLSELYA